MRRYTFESLKLAFEPSLRNTLQDEHDRRATWLEDQLASLEGDLAAWVTETHENNPPASETLDNLLTRLLHWSSEFAALPVQLELEKVVERWETRYQHISAELPPMLELPLEPEEYRHIQHGDPFRVILWRIRFALRMLLRSSKRGPIIRRISPDAFLRMHLGTIVLDTLHEQWTEEVRASADAIRPTHIATVDRVRRLLPEEDESEQGIEPLAPFDAETLASEILEIAQQLTPSTPDLEDTGDRIIERICFLWTFAGTRIVPNRSWSSHRWHQELSARNHTFRKATYRWVQVLLLKGDEWGKDLDLLRLEVRSRRVGEEVAKAIPDRIQRDTLPEFERMREALRNAQRAARQLDSYDEFRSFLNRDARSILKELRQERLPTVADRLLEAKLDAVPDEVLQRVRDSISAMNPIRHILTKLDIRRPIPRYRFAEIPLADTVSLDLFDILKRGLFRFTQLTTGSLSEMSSRISDIDQVVQFALDTSSNLLGRKRDTAPVSKARTELSNGFRRALAQVDELQEELNKLGRTTVDAIGTRLRRYQGGVRELIDNDRAFAVQASVMKARTRLGLTHGGSTVARGFSTLGKNIGRVFGQIFRWIRGAYIDIRRLSGLEMANTSVDPRLLQLITEAHEQIQALPLVYQRIFRLFPLDDERFFVSREKELAELNRQVELWRRGHIASTAIVGERGSGRTTLVKIALLKYFKQDKICWIDLDQTIEDPRLFAQHLGRALKLKKADTINRIEKELLEGERMVIVFEDVHNLFLRTIDGFEALQRFLLLIARTSSKIFWILTCTTYSWSFLDKVMGIGGQVQWVLQLNDLSTEEITQALMRRSRASGFKIRFEPNEKIAQSRAYRRLRTEEDRQRLLLSAFFSSLSRFAAGNITVAILFWLHSIRGNDGGVLRLSPDISFDPSFVRSFHPDDLFTLQAFAVHEFLDANQHSRVFHQDEEVSRAQLLRLRNTGVLEESVGGYRIHPFLFRPVVAVLKERSMLE
ncbi:MAG: hypothetical protein V2A56_12495 [bacterium]